MKFLFFDQSTGVSGDKINAALFGLHQDRDVIEKAIAGLGLPGVSVKISPHSDSGLSAWSFKSVEDSPGHDHRGLKDIEKIINGAKLPQGVRDLSLKIFNTLATAEAAVHGSDIDSVHFHEVGAVDAICDIVCAAVQIEKIGPDKIYATPYSLESGGEVMSAHGLLPVPVPAVLEIVKGLPVSTRDIHDEITTPTGAAIMKNIVDEYRIPLSFIPEAVSYGAGTKKFAFPNLLRVIRGTILQPSPDETRTDAPEKIWQIETQVDDMNPQIIPEVLEGLHHLGAADAFCMNVMMKKGRPGFLFTALADEKHLDACTDYLLSATPSIGLRYFKTDRRLLKREIVRRDTPFGEIRFKRVVLPNGTLREVPEFEDVKAAALREGIAVYLAFQKILG